MSDVEADPEDIPFPLLEKGDFVRLKEPYQPMNYGSGLRETITVLGRRLVDEDSDQFPWEEASQANFGWFKQQDRMSKLFEFTHGTIVEVVNWYPANEFTTQNVRVVRYENEGGGPPRNVSLHLYNPETGLMYVGDHPTETGKPEFVDFHAADIVLVHKHDDAWGHEYDIDVAEVYGEWGIEDIGIPPEEGENDG